MQDDQAALDRRMDNLEKRTHAKFSAMQDATSKMQSQLAGMMNALDSDFAANVALLRDLDHKINETLAVEEINAEEIVQLVDTREQILQKLLEAIQARPELKQEQQWQEAVQTTQTVVELMQSKTNELAMALQKYRHGKRSVQQYQKFL
jgi:flagellar rod protein FlaI